MFTDARQLGLRPRSIVLLLGFQLAGTVVELAGLAALLPVFQYIQAHGDIAALVADFGWWGTLASVYEAISLPLTLATLLATSMAALLLRQAIVYVRLVYQVRVRESLIARRRAAGFACFISADNAYQERHVIGRLVNDLTTDLTRAIEYVFSSVALAGFAIIFLIYLGALFGISAPLTAVALIIFGITLYAVRGQLRKTETVSQEIVDANQNMSAFLIERLEHARLVRLAGMEAAESTQMSALTERQRDRLVRIFTLLANLEIIIEPLVVGAALVFLYVSVAVFDMHLEHVGLFLVLIMRLLPVVKETARIRQAKRGTRASFLAVSRRLAEMEAAREVSTGERRFDRLEDGIEFDDVCFTYPSTSGDAPALKGVSVTIEAGLMTALVGLSGAGKSTLFDLLPRLRLPQSGRVLLDGRNYADFTLDSLRAGIAYAPQSPQIFNVALAEHIGYGRAGASREEIRSAAELANAAAFIEQMPDGYDTLAGERGSRLSGGQRQRLDLARALVRRAPILLLDEPTSNLDAESESLFRDALVRIRDETDIAVMVIAHRLSTVTMADKIVVLQAGQVVAEGKHDALVAAGGWYADAFAKQSGFAATA